MEMPCIVGWGHTPFGKQDNVDAEQLFREAALAALESAGLGPADVDAVFVGHFNGGFVRQDFSGAMAGVAIPELRHTPRSGWRTPARPGPPRSGRRWTRSAAAGCGGRWSWVSRR